MKDYTTSVPEFSDSIKILETTDPGHADNVNVTTIQLLQNTLVLLEILSEESIKEAFSSVFTGTEEGSSMASVETGETVSTEWNGEASMNPAALKPDETEESASIN